MYVSRGGHGIHDVTSSSVSFFGGDFKTREKREKKKREKRTPSRKFATPVRGKDRKVTTHDSSLSERERKRKRKEEEEEERAPRFNNGAAFRARGERS